jgi:hypothetical protein
MPFAPLSRTVPRPIVLPELRLSHLSHELRPQPTSPPCSEVNRKAKTGAPWRALLRWLAMPSNRPVERRVMASPLPGCSQRWDAPQASLESNPLRSNLSTQCVIDCASSNPMISLNNPTIPTSSHCERLYPLSLAPFFPTNDLNELATVLLLAQCSQ